MAGSEKPGVRLRRRRLAAGPTTPPPAAPPPATPPPAVPPPAAGPITKSLPTDKPPPAATTGAACHCASCGLAGTDCTAAGMSELSRVKPGAASWKAGSAPAPQGCELLQRRHRWVAGPKQPQPKQLQPTGRFERASGRFYNSRLIDALQTAFGCGLLAAAALVLCLGLASALVGWCAEHLAACIDSPVSRGGLRCHSAPALAFTIGMLYINENGRGAMAATPSCRAARHRCTARRPPGTPHRCAPSWRGPPTCWCATSRVRSHCRFRKRGTHSISGSGIERVSGDATQRCDRALATMRLEILAPLSGARMESHTLFRESGAENSKRIVASAAGCHARRCGSCHRSSWRRCSARPSSAVRRRVAVVRRVIQMPLGISYMDNH
jgi:hypothetical protein